jgi:NADH-quinone oxidoreductase subunit G
VGSLTTKDFRFKKRVWYLKTSESICDGCSQGCNTTVSQEGGIVYRIEPRENQEVNKWWMCDEGRYRFYHTHSPSRVLGPADLSKGDAKSIMWSEALTAAKEMFGAAKNVAFFVCADATIEEAEALKRNFSDAAFYSYSPSVEKSAEDKAIDHLLRRADKSPNLKGLEQAGFKSSASFDPKKYDLCVFVSAGKVIVPYGLAAKAKKALGIGVFMKEELEGYDLILPALSSHEKSGSFVNHQGKQQSFKAAIPPLGMCRPLENILSALKESARKVG